MPQMDRGVINTRPVWTVLVTHTHAGMGTRFLLKNVVHRVQNIPLLFFKRQILKSGWEVVLFGKLPGASTLEVVNTLARP